MQYLIIVFCIAISVIGFKIEKRIYNPLTVFYVFWTIIVGLASLCLFKMKQTSQSTYTIVFLGLLSFFGAYLLTRFLQKRHLTRATSEKEKLETQKETEADRFSLRYMVIYILFGITILYLLYRSYSIIQLLISGNSLWEIRKLYFTTGSVVTSSKFIQVYDVYVNKTLVELIFPTVSAIAFFKYKKRMMLIVSIVIAILNSLISGGRLVFYYMFVLLVFSMLIYSKYSINLKGFSIKNLNWQIFKKKGFYYVAIPIVFCFAAIWALTSIRSGTSLFHEAYIYFAGCMPHLDLRLGIIDKHHYFTYGIAIISGILKPIFICLNNVLGLPYPQFYTTDLNLLNVNNFVFIGKDLKFNAFVTPFFYFYLDGGIIGVILGSALYGAICAFSYRKAVDCPNIRNIALYLLIIVGITTSMIRFQFVMPAYVLAFVGILFLFTKKHIGVKIEKDAMHCT